jgi:hypothetical protein
MELITLFKLPLLLLHSAWGFSSAHLAPSHWRKEDALPSQIRNRLGPDSQHHPCLYTSRQVATVLLTFCWLFWQWCSAPSGPHRHYIHPLGKGGFEFAIGNLSSYPCAWRWAAEGNSNSRTISGEGRGGSHPPKAPPRARQKALSSSPQLPSEAAIAVTL